jgi:uncharacterized membrane protein
MHTKRAFPTHDPRGAIFRLAAAATLGAVTFVALSGVATVAVRAVAAWDVAGGTMLALLWTIIARSDARETRRRAAASDPGRGVAWALVLIGSTFSVFGGTAVMRQAKTLAPGANALFCVLALVAVVVAWALTHSAYALRYAHLYYREDDEGVGGIELPGGGKPSDFDFAYFAFTIGMCFQVSDITVTSAQIRRAVLLHSVLSFAYNTAVVALALNLAFGVLG